MASFFPRGRTGRAGAAGADCRGNDGQRNTRDLPRGLDAWNSPPPHAQRRGQQGPRGGGGRGADPPLPINSRAAAFFESRPPPAPAHRRDQQRWRGGDRPRAGTALAINSHSAALRPNIESGTNGSMRGQNRSTDGVPKRNMEHPLAAAWKDIVGYMVELLHLRQRMRAIGAAEDPAFQCLFAKVAEQREWLLQRADEEERKVPVWQTRGWMNEVQPLFVMCMVVAPVETVDHFIRACGPKETKALLRLEACMEQLYATQTGDKYCIFPPWVKGSPLSGSIRAAFQHSDGVPELFQVKALCVLVDTESGDKWLLRDELWDRIRRGDIEGVKRLLKSTTLSWPIKDSTILDELKGRGLEASPNEALWGFRRLLYSIKQYMYLTDDPARKPDFTTMLTSLGISPKAAAQDDELCQARKEIDGLVERFKSEFDPHNTTDPLNGGWWEMLRATGYERKLASCVPLRGSTDDVRSRHDLFKRMFEEVAMQMGFQFHDTRGYDRFRQMYNNPGLIRLIVVEEADNLGVCELIWRRLHYVVDTLYRYVFKEEMELEEAVRLVKEGAQGLCSTPPQPQQTWFYRDRDVQKLDEKLVKLSGPLPAFMTVDKSRDYLISSLVCNGDGGLSVERWLEHWRSTVGELVLPYTTFQSWLFYLFRGDLKLRDNKRKSFGDAPLTTVKGFEEFFAGLITAYPLLIDLAGDLAAANGLGILDNAKPQDDCFLGPYYNDLIAELHGIADSRRGR